MGRYFNPEEWSNHLTRNNHDRDDGNLLRRVLRVFKYCDPVFRTATAAMMVSSKKRLPDLDHCVQTLQGIPRDISSKPPKNMGELYVAAVGLLYHLKVDQAHLRAIW